MPLLLRLCFQQRLHRLLDRGKMIWRPCLEVGLNFSHILGDLVLKCLGRRREIALKPDELLIGTRDELEACCRPADSFSQVAMGQNIPPGDQASKLLLQLRPQMIFEGGQQLLRRCSMRDMQHPSQALLEVAGGHHLVCPDLVPAKGCAVIFWTRNPQQHRPVYLEEPAERVPNHVSR